MDNNRWNQLVAEIEGDDIEAMVEACERLYRESAVSDVPRLLELLRHEDFVVREAAAWPLANVGGPYVLAELFTAYRRGYDEGHDNDGFTAALIALVEFHPRLSRKKLQELRETSNPVFQRYSNWLLTEFC